jgi:hypothetical protein
MLQKGKYDCFELWNMMDQGKEQYIHEDKAPNNAEQDMLSNKEQNMRIGTNALCYALCYAWTCFVVYSTEKWETKILKLLKTKDKNESLWQIRAKEDKALSRQNKKEKEMNLLYGVTSILVSFQFRLAGFFFYDQVAICSEYSFVVNLSC